MGVRSAAKELGAFARQALLLGKDLTAPALPRGLQPGEEVVVCLHGLMATAGVMRPLRSHIERAGLRTAALTYKPGPGVRTLARQLGALLEQLPPDVYVHLLGHSLGGVVTRYYAQEIGDRRLLQTISLAAPFAGLRHASRAQLQLSRDLDRNSPLLRKLLLGAERSLALPHLSVVAEDDTIVTPPRAHALPHGDVVVLRDCGHNGLLFDPRVAKLVVEQLRAHAPPRRRQARAGATEQPGYGAGTLPM